MVPLREVSGKFPLENDRCIVLHADLIQCISQVLEVAGAGSHSANRSTDPSSAKGSVRHPTHRARTPANEIVRDTGELRCLVVSCGPVISQTAILPSRTCRLSRTFLLMRKTYQMTPDADPPLCRVRPGAVYICNCGIAPQAGRNADLFALAE
jgi:hypothetical protein